MKSTTSRSRLANDHLHIEAYADVAYASDKENSKSTIGYCTYIRGNLVTWQSHKQKVVSWSSAKSKYRAMVETA